jgi:hypothetical protein
MYISQVGFGIYGSDFDDLCSALDAALANPRDRRVEDR